jgi:hypothetical protein
MHAYISSRDKPTSTWCAQLRLVCGCCWCHEHRAHRCRAPQDVHCTAQHRTQHRRHTALHILLYSTEQHHTHDHAPRAATIDLGKPRTAGRPLCECRGPAASWRNRDPPPCAVGRPCRGPWWRSWGCSPRPRFLRLCHMRHSSGSSSATFTDGSTMLEGRGLLVRPHLTCGTGAASQDQCGIRAGAA